MAIVAPATPVFEYGQSGTVTVTLSTATNVADWTTAVYLRAYNGGTTLASPTATATDPANGVWEIPFTTTHLSPTAGPGAYVWSFYRTNSGYEFPIVDDSGFIIRASNSSAYPTLTNLAEYTNAALGGVTPSDAEARQLIQLLATAEDWVQRYCNRRFTYVASQTIYLDGNGERDVLLPQLPVVSITSVKVDQTGYYGDGTDAFSEDALTAGTDYVLVKDDPDNTGQSRSGILRRIGTVWPYSLRRPYELIGHHKAKCPGCIKVVATCGYQLIPYPIKAAVWALTTILVETAENGRLVMSESGEGHSVSYGGVDDMPWTVRSLLNPFRKVII